MTKMTVYLYRSHDNPRSRWRACLRMKNSTAQYDIARASWADLVGAAATLSMIIGAEVHLIKEGGRYTRAIVVGRDDVVVVINRG